MSLLLLLVSLFLVAVAEALVGSTVLTSAFAQPDGRESAWPAVAAGAGLALLLVLVGGGRAPHWGFLLGAGEAVVDLPGPGLLFGLALLAALGGAILLAAERLGSAASTPTSIVARLTGQRLLLLALGLLGLGIGFGLAQGLDRSAPALRAGAHELAALAALTGVLGLALGQRLGAAEIHVCGALRLASGVTLLATAGLGLEGWLRQGSYATPPAVAAACASLLGLAALEPTHLALPPRVLFLASLAFLLV